MRKYVVITNWSCFPIFKAKYAKSSSCFNPVPWLIRNESFEVCMIRADMIEILENKKEGRKKLKAKNQLKIARERISWKQIAIKTTLFSFRQGERRFWWQSKKKCDDVMGEASKVSQLWSYEKMDKVNLSSKPNSSFRMEGNVRSFELPKIAQRTSRLTMFKFKMVPNWLCRTQNFSTWFLMMTTTRVLFRSRSSYKRRLTILIERVWEDFLDRHTYLLPLRLTISRKTSEIGLVTSEKWP